MILKFILRWSVGKLDAPNSPVQGKMFIPGARHIRLENFRARKLGPLNENATNRRWPNPTLLPRNARVAIALEFLKA
ncbi:hypothetical protein COP2_032484 [Malus domestica]